MSAACAENECQIPPPDPPRRETFLLQVKTVELIYYRYASVATNAFPLDDLYIDGKWIYRETHNGRRCMRIDDAGSGP